MSRPVLLGWAITLAVAMGTVIPSTLAYRHAAARTRGARTQEALSHGVRIEVERIVQALPAWTRLEPDRTDESALAQRFAAAVTASGLPASTVESFTPTPSAVIELVPGVKGCPTIARGRASVALTNITLPQLGRLLEIWCHGAPGWTATRIDITPLRLSATEAARYAGADLPLRVGVSIERLTASGLAPLLPESALAPSAESKDVPR